MKSRLSIFILVSISIHFASLAFYNENTFVLNISEKNNIPLQISITQSKHTILENKATINQAYKNLKNKTIISEKAPTIDLKKSPSKKPTETQKSNTLSEEKLTDKDIFNKSIQTLPSISQVSSILKKELTKYFYYPRVAKRRQWQGQVLVEFTIFSNGIIDNIKIIRSSGYSILDSAALDSVKQIKQQEKFSLALNGNQANQILPITYKLIN